MAYGYHLTLSRIARSLFQVSAQRCASIEVARRQSAKSWDLRATTSLARLWQQQGKGDEVRRALEEICGWFTEEHDTRDLKEAKALLDELASDTY